MTKVKSIELFKAEWCGACNGFKPIWNSLKPMLEKNGIKTKEYEETNFAHKNEMQKNNITSFPTLYYHDGMGNKTQIYDRSPDNILHVAGIGLTGGGDNDLYYNKYLKYKNKYLEIKTKNISSNTNQTGGSFLKRKSNISTPDINTITTKINEIKDTYLPELKIFKNQDWSKELEKIFNPDNKDHKKTLNNIMDGLSKLIGKEHAVHFQYPDKLLNDKDFIAITIQNIGFWDDNMENRLKDIITFCSGVNLLIEKNNLPPSVFIKIVARYLVKEHVLIDDNKSIDDSLNDEQKKNIKKDALKASGLHAMAILIIISSQFHKQKNKQEYLNGLHFAIITEVLKEQSKEVSNKMKNSLDNMQQLKLMKANIHRKKEL